MIQNLLSTSTSARSVQFDPRYRVTSLDLALFFGVPHARLLADIRVGREKVEYGLVTEATGGVQRVIVLYDGNAREVIRKLPVRGANRKIIKAAKQELSQHPLTSVAELLCIPPFPRPGDSAETTLEEVVASVPPPVSGELPALVQRRDDGELFTTTLAIAAWVGRQHQDVLRLVGENDNALRELGEVVVEIRLNPQGSSTSYAVLNRGQAMLLMTFMRNIGVVIEFKVRLIKAFLDMEKRLDKGSNERRSLPPVPEGLPDFTNPPSAARGWAEQYERATGLEKQLKEQAPKVAFAERIASTAETYSVAQVAQMFGTGRQRLYKILREVGMVVPGTKRPYQKYIESGDLVFRMPRVHGHGKLTPTPATRITGKGQTTLYALAVRHGLIKPQEVVDSMSADGTIPPGVPAKRPRGRPRIHPDARAAHRAATRAWRARKRTKAPARDGNA